MYRVIEAQKADFTIVRMTGLLEVSRSGFYKWRAAQAAGPTPAQRRREVIDAKVKGFQTPQIRCTAHRGSWPICGMTGR
jgi:hypothetical protein